MVSTRLFLLVIITLLFGCTAVPNSKRFENVITKNSEEVNQYKYETKSQNKFDISFIANGENGCIQGFISDCPYKQEAKYLKTWPPKIGLSLSGGGTRAASFSIGVMKALKETGLLDKVDLISSVSGGSYANYWYFSQQFYNDRLTKLKMINPSSTDIFKTWDETSNNLDDPDLYRFQRTLEESSEILGYAHKPSFTKDLRVGAQYGFETMVQLLSIPLDWTFNGLFDWEVNITPFYYFYKDGLDRTYGYVPLDYTLEHFANSDTNTVNVKVDAEPILLGDIKTFLEENTSKKLPYFIINTTARFGKAMDKDGKNNERNMDISLLEFTPWGCHSRLLNVHESCPLKDFHLGNPFGWMELDLARIVASSGAAIDGQMQFVDISGKEEDAYHIGSESFLEIGLDLANLNLGYTLQNQNASIWQRGIHKLLPWPLYLIHDYFLESPTSVHLSDGGHSENLGILPLINRGTECIIAVDAEQDPNAIFESYQRLQQTLKKHGLKISAIKDKSKLINVHDIAQLEDAVTEWEVIKEDNKSLEKPIHIIYIKLAAPSRYKEINRKDIPYSVDSYLEEHRDFPHETTADVLYSAEQFRAYRDLGYAITRKYFSKHP